MNGEEIAERLRRHYDENVLGFERNPEYGELEKKLKGSDGKKLLAEELAKSHGQPNVIEADLEGTEIVDFDYGSFGKK